MHDMTLLQLIEDDLAPSQELLALMQEEGIALHGRDMPLLESLLARKQSLVVLLEQQGRRRSQLLIDLGLSPDRAGVEALAAQSAMGERLLQQLDALGELMDACQRANATNGVLIQRQQFATSNQIRILSGGETPSLYDSRGSTSPISSPRAISQV